MDKKSLDIIVEEFFDTGKLVLREDIEFDVDNEDFGVESEEDIEIYNDENISQEDIDYIKKEYWWLKNGENVRVILSSPPFNHNPSQINNNSINGYVVRYIVSNEVENGNNNVFIKEGFEVFLEKVNSVLGTNYENIKTFNELTRKREIEKLKSLYKMSGEYIKNWIASKEENKKKYQIEPLDPKTIKDRVNKLKKYLSTTNVWEIKDAINDLLKKFKLYGVKNFELGEIIDYFKGNPTKECYLNFISRGSDGGRNYWKTFVKFSKGINEIITNNKIPDEQIKLGKDSTQKYTKSLKTYFEKIKNKEYCYIFSNNCELSSSDIEKVMDFFGETYENSFLTKGFKKDDTRATESRIHNLGNVDFSFSEKIKSDDFDVDDISNFIINNIEDYLKGKDSITKYDLLADGDIKDSGGNVIIPDNGKVEVKDINNQDSYLSEFLASPVKKTEYGVRNNPIYLKRYNEVTGKVYDYINKNKKEDIIDKIKVGLSGIIIANNIYVPNEDNNIEFYLSNVGRSNPENQLRIAVRYHINKNNWRNFYKIGDDGILNPIEEEPNIPTKEKRIYETKSKTDKIITNFFDTGKLVLNELDIPDEQKDKLRGVGKELKDKKNLIMSFFNNLKNGQKNKDIPTKSIKFFITALDIFNKNTHINNDILNGRESIINNLNTYIFDATKEIEEYLKKTIKEGVDLYRTGNYEESTQKYVEVINTYNDIPIKVGESLDVDITLLQGWIKNNQKVIDNINRNRVHTNPKVSDEFLSKLQKFKEENPDLFIKLNLKNEKDVEEVTIEDDIKFNDLLKQQIEEDKTHRYGKWSIGSISNDTLNNLERIYTTPKGKNEIYTTYTIDDLKESIMKVIFSQEGQTIIMRNTILTDYGLTNMGGILYRLVSSNLINKGQIRLINKGDRDWDIKNKINKSSKAPDSKIVPTPITVDQFLTNLGFDRIDSLPIQYVSTKKPSPADDYEQSFGNICDGIKYFQVTKGEGNTSRISKTKNYNKSLLQLVGDVKMGVNYITGVTYSEIITNETLKYDIKTLEPVTLNGLNTDQNFTLSVGDPIEVKKSSYENGFHLIEFYGAFKNYTKEQREAYLNMDKFTEVLEGLREKLQSEIEVKSGKGWEIIKSINDVTKGVFFEDYIFVPKDSYTLSWSTEGARPYEPRLTIRVDYIEGAPVYKWEEGNCNLTEPNPLEESITNFFDTGNFEF